MAGQVVQMDYAVVGEVSKGFTAQSQAAKVIGQVTNTIITALLANPFVSMTIGPLLQNINTAVQQKTKELSELCDEFARDLTQAIGDHRKGDYEGKTYFGPKG